jgi:alpha-L-arabinofuranosidase
LPTKVEAASVQEKAPTGAIGVGTWNTSAEFKDVKVTAPDGKVLFDGNIKTDWKFLGGGSWTSENGVLKQTAEKEFVRAIAGDKSWSDYTLELKARKISGREGFLILFHIGDDEDRIWWNVGGWGNTQSGVELGETRDPKKVTVEDNRWYDLKVEVKGASVKCWLDGKLTHEVKDSLQTTRGIFASSARDEKTGELILKIVNGANEATDVTVSLDGAKKLGSEAKGVILTSGNAKDENSIETPQKVSPQPLTLKIANGVITHTFPANSFTVLRVSAK